MREARRVSPAPLRRRLLVPRTRSMPAIAGWSSATPAAFLDPIFSTGVLLAMQSGIEAAEAIDARAPRRRPVARRGSPTTSAACAQRYHHFRRFAVGFYDPAFRDLFFTPSSRFGIYEAVLSVLAGNWRPSLATRLRLALFFPPGRAPARVPDRGAGARRPPSATP